MITTKSWNGKIGWNMGSGQRSFKSTPEVKWINVDCQEVEMDGKLYCPDILDDISKSWDALDNSVDYVVFHHVVEHFGCGEAPLGEAHRVLKPGGSLLVFVPDMRALAQAWLMGKMDTQLYMTNIYGAYHGDEHDRHRWGYTLESLGATLRDLFKEVRPFDWRVIPGGDFAKDWWILAMEAVK